MDTFQIPYAVHEGEMARMERTVKRLWILCIIIFLALIVTNAGWIWYESQQILQPRLYAGVMTKIKSAAQ